MSDQAQQRIWQVLATARLAFEMGLVVGAWDLRGGRPISVLLSTRPGVMPPRGRGSTAAVTLRLGDAVGHYTEEYRRGDGDRRLVTYDLPFDFATTFEIADIWDREWVGAPDPPRKAFPNAESLVTFLAHRLVG